MLYRHVILQNISSGFWKSNNFVPRDLGFNLCHSFGKQNSFTHILLHCYLTLPSKLLVVTIMSKQDW